MAYSTTLIILCSLLHRGQMWKNILTSRWLYIISFLGSLSFSVCCVHSYNVWTPPFLSGTLSSHCVRSSSPEEQSGTWSTPNSQLVFHIRPSLPHSVALASACGDQPSLQTHFGKGRQNTVPLCLVKGRVANRACKLHVADYMCTWAELQPFKCPHLQLSFSGNFPQLLNITGKWHLVLCS